MENETKMMCPFRRNENGDFEPCYGKACMAYYEWKSCIFDEPGRIEPGRISTMREVNNVCCRLLFPNAGINGFYPVI